MTRWPLYIVLVIIGLALAVWIAAGGAQAKWKPEYAKSDPKIQAWYKSQRNAQGQWCCDESDGHRYDGGYTLNGDGSVTLHLKEGDHTLPAYMVLTKPNPNGHAVWFYLETGGNRTDFCFAPGTLT
jgi:hypothetical protein